MIRKNSAFALIATLLLCFCKFAWGQGNAEAAKFSREGFQATKDKDWNKAVDSFHKASELDHKQTPNLVAVLQQRGTAYANEQKFPEAIADFSEALKMYSQTLPPEHKLIAITRIRLGRALLRQNHYAEAESQSRTGYLLLTQQPIPPQNWLTDARTDLVQEYEAMHQPLKAAYYRAALAIHPRPISPNQPSSNP